MVYFIEIILSFRAADIGSVSRARSGSGLVTRRAGPRTSLDSGYSLFQNIPKFLLHNTTMFLFSFTLKSYLQQRTIKST